MLIFPLETQFATPCSYFKINMIIEARWLILAFVELHNYQTRYFG